MADDITNFDNIDEVLTGDTIDDLSDIVIDLLEVKWRIKITASIMEYGTSN